jgi:4a-hydroxytetrahydrobiopterin dehydratase
MARIDEDRADALLKELSGWVREGESIRRQFAFAGFADAVAFVVRLGFTAEVADHHPGLLIDYKRVTATYTTHSEGGLTEKDFEGARAATSIAASLGGH